MLSYHRTASARDNPIQLVSVTHISNLYGKLQKEKVARRRSAVFPRASERIVGWNNQVLARQDVKNKDGPRILSVT